MKTQLIIGSSRGIGEAVAKHFHEKGDRVIGVSRSKPSYGEWIPADISTPEGIKSVAEAIKDVPLDGLLFMGGIWEENAFTDDFSFEASSDEESRLVISVNLIAPIEITRIAIANLAMTENPRAIYMGALSSLDQSATAEVANTASKFGLRGAIQSLRLSYRKQGIGFTVINPGYVGTPEVMSDINEGTFSGLIPIPLKDICSAIDWIFSLSSATEVGDINLMQANE